MTVTDRIADLSLLWKQASIVFPYFDRRPIDWDQTYRDYLPKILAADEELSFHLLLAEFINQLQDGHTDYSFPRDLSEKIGSLPFALTYLQDRYYIQAIAADGEEHLAARVLSINRIPMEEILSKAFRYIYHVGRYAPPSRLHRILPLLLRQTGNELETTAGVYHFDLIRAVLPLMQIKPAAVPVPFRSVLQGNADIRLYEGNVLYIGLPDFLHHDIGGRVAAVLDEPPCAKGVILDLRENIGGMTAYGARIAELFISGQFHACQKRTRTMTGIDISSAVQIARESPEQTARYISQGLCDQEEVERCRKIHANIYFQNYLDTFGTPEHRAVYTGPCVILTSRNTVSAAEDFAAMFRSNQRAAIIGTPTQGTTGTPLLLSLSCGGRARVCSVGYRLLDGTEFIGCGIQPDLYVDRAEDDLAQGVDPVLTAALRHLGAASCS